MRRIGFMVMCRTVCVTGFMAAFIPAPSLAQQGSDQSSFAKRNFGTASDFPASTGRFEPRRTDEPSGPVDISAASTVQSSSWRMCRQCGYPAAGPKPFKAIGIRANFQPFGGTFRYSF